MKTTISVSVDKQAKDAAQAVAKEIGIPLSSLLNAYLKEIAVTGAVRFEAAEPMTPQMEKIIEQAEKEIAAGELSGPFRSAKELFTHLDSLA